MEGVVLKPTYFGIIIPVLTTNPPHGLLQDNKMTKKIITTLREVQKGGFKKHQKYIARNIITHKNKKEEVRKNNIYCGLW